MQVNFTPIFTNNRMHVNFYKYAYASEFSRIFTNIHICKWIFTNIYKFLCASEFYTNIYKYSYASEIYTNIYKYSYMPVNLTKPITT